MSQAVAADALRGLLAGLESWRFTPLAQLAEPAFAPAERPKALAPLAGRVLCPLGFHRLVLENGRRESKFELLKDVPAGVTISGLAEGLRDHGDALQPLLERALPEGLPLAELARSRFRDGALIRVARRVRLDQPIHVVHRAEARAGGPAQAAHVLSLVVLEPGASAVIVEEALSGGETPFWTNSLLRVVLGEDSALRHYRVAREGPAGRRSAAVLVESGRGSRYESHAFNLGGGFSREDLRLDIAGEGADCALNGLALLRGDEAADHHTVVTHGAAGGTTRQLYKAVLDGRSRFVFDGLITVRPGAQKTDARVYNKNLLLSEDAAVNTNPEFNILADDVSCRHGGTVGQISPEALFYLRSRGLGAEKARRLLVYAFGAEMLSRVSLEPLRVAIAGALRARMPEEAL